MVIANHVLRTLTMTTNEKYPFIQFKTKFANLPVTWNGMMISKWLLVGFAPDKERLWVYNSNGLRITELSFVNWEDAIAFAEWYQGIYGSYLDIWDIYPQAEIHTLVQWTIKNGVRWVEFVKMLQEQKPVNFQGTRIVV